MTGVRALVGKATVQAIGVGIFAGTACTALFTGNISGEQFMILAVMAIGWAYNQKPKAE